MEGIARELMENVGRLKGDLELTKIIRIGAEAVLLKGKWLGKEVIVKYRYPKGYRDKRLDNILRKVRTVNEAKLLAESKILGIPVPSLLYLDADSGLIVMDYIEGVRLKDVLNEVPVGKLKEMFSLIGFYVGSMHSKGFIHGDLTTSNLIFTSDEKLFFIDFGLGEFTNELEKQGVDVHLMLRALESTHPSLAHDLFSSFMEGYAKVRGNEWRKRIEEKVKEIRMRGRYVSERRRKRSF